MMMKLVLVRHNESGWSKKDLFTGWMGMSLSGKGHEEAKATGQFLKAKGYNFDICFTPYLKHTTHTLNHILSEIDRDWFEVVKSWKLNERHYGAFQGLNKTEIAEKYDEEQAKIWRRSLSTKPPVLDPNDDRSIKKSSAYHDVDLALPSDCESLETMIEGAVPYSNEMIHPEMEAGKRIITAAHGNSLRTLIKHFDNISEEDIVGANIPIGTPLVYEPNDSFKPTRRYYLGDQEAPGKEVETVASQGKKQA